MEELIVERKAWRGNMDVDDHQACTSMDTTENDGALDNDGIHWHFSQVKGNIEPDGGIASDADIISCVEFSHDGEFLATGDKGGRVVIFQRDQSGKFINGQRSTDYNVYSTFQSHEPEFDYLKSLEIEEKINQIKWLKRKNAANFILSTNVFEESEDPASRSFFSEIIASVSDVKFSHNGRYLLTRDYLTAKVWDINMESGPVETYSVHDYLRSKLCTLYENDSIFDKFEVDWSGDDNHILTGSYNNFFRSFKRGVDASVAKTYEAHVEKSHVRLPTRRVLTAGAARVNKKRVLAGTVETQADEDVSADSLDFTKKILHTAWHPKQNIIALAATNRLYIFQDK
ncbi:WD domain, G-beta repeat protein [Onchocerca flexuosa]|uniref:Serine/threonine-protein phosphatase 2A 55 kDa regulatory subunit B n=1 Tax=Onchocerca flexuosa TaxID=387005 RepID=A0A238BL73_9BILA|nr:WD domain, G-beta repeat protein [Onchocerca flexuosa]